MPFLSDRSYSSRLHRIGNATSEYQISQKYADRLWQADSLLPRAYVDYPVKEGVDHAYCQEKLPERHTAPHHHRDKYHQLHHPLTLIRRHSLLTQHRRIPNNQVHLLNGEDYVAEELKKASLTLAEEN